MIIQYFTNGMHFMSEAGDVNMSNCERRGWWTRVPLVFLL